MFEEKWRECFIGEIGPYLKDKSRLNINSDGTFIEEKIEAIYRGFVFGASLEIRIKDRVLQSLLPEEDK